MAYLFYRHYFKVKKEMNENHAIQDLTQILS